MTFPLGLEILLALQGFPTQAVMSMGYEKKGGRACFASHRDACTLSLNPLDRQDRLKKIGFEGF
jgi:hypothetical protein